jgi:alcohol dehydrogenase
MRAAIYEEFRGPLTIQNVPDPVPGKNGAVLRVKATGICRSDWHGWMGNDIDIKLPLVPGHEFSGIVETVGRDVTNWKKGDRVTLPFVCGCGTCEQCLSGNHQVCDRQFQPGFTHWGAFAEYVAIDYADINLVRLPEEMDFVSAASLGCRFVTSFRAVVEQGQVTSGQHVVIYGCGGVGLSAIMIANALGARVVAIDVNDEALDLAKAIGAAVAINARQVTNTVEAIREITQGGAHVSIDALGSPEACFNSIASLRKRGCHVQIGLMEAADRRTLIPMDQVVGKELKIVGSHGMQAYKYREVFDMISQGRLCPEKLVGKMICLEDAPEELINMNNFQGIGVTVIDSF